MLNLRGVLYYSQDLQPPRTTAIYLLGNPLVIWPVLAAMSASLWLAARHFVRSLDGLVKPSAAQAGLLFAYITYWLNLLPYLLVKRSSFIYHYSACGGGARRRPGSHAARDISPPFAS